MVGPRSLREKIKKTGLNKMMRAKRHSVNKVVVMKDPHRRPPPKKQETNSVGRTLWYWWSLMVRE